jgi:hypothetical protein
MVVVATAPTAALCHNTLAAMPQVYEAGDRGCGRDSSATTIVAVASAMEWLQCHNSRLGLGATVSEDAVMVVAVAKPSDTGRLHFITSGRIREAIPSATASWMRLSSLLLSVSFRTGNMIESLFHVHVQDC